MAVSAIVITKNEQRHVGECLAKLAWADEVMVLDSFSTDDSVAMAKDRGATVYQHAFESFPRQRNVALGLASCEWVLFVDADERVTPDLADEVMRITGSSDQTHAGYWVPRRNIICGRWIRGGGWYPDYQLRLLRRERARYDEQREVHELVELEGTSEYLEHALFHFNYDRWSQVLAKQRAYAAIEARSMFCAGVRPRARNFILQPLRESHRRYIQLGGYRDGLHGLLLAALLGYYTMTTYWQLRKLL